MTDGPITASQIQGQGNITLTHSSAKTNEVEVKKVTQTEISQIFKNLKSKKGDEEKKMPQQFILVKDEVEGRRKQRDFLDEDIEQIDLLVADAADDDNEYTPMNQGLPKSKLQQPKTVSDWSQKAESAKVKSE